MSDEDEDVPGLSISPSLGHYTTGFTAIIKDGKPVEPVSSLGPIGFVTRRPTAATLKRLRTAQRKRSKA